MRRKIRTLMLVTSSALLGFLIAGGLYGFAWHRESFRTGSELTVSISRTSFTYNRWRSIQAGQSVADRDWNWLGAWYHTYTFWGSQRTNVIIPTWMLFVVLGSYPLYAWVRHARTRQVRWRTGLCVKCGYDLTGNATGKCSECGATVDGEQPDAC